MRRVSGQLCRVVIAPAGPALPAVGAPLMPAGVAGTAAGQLPLIARVTFASVPTRTCLELLDT